MSQEEIEKSFPEGNGKRKMGADSKEKMKLWRLAQTFGKEHKNTPDPKDSTKLLGYAEARDLEFARLKSEAQSRKKDPLHANGLAGIDYNILKQDQVDLLKRTFYGERDATGTTTKAGMFVSGRKMFDFLYKENDDGMKDGVKIPTRRQIQGWMDMQETYQLFRDHRRPVQVTPLTSTPFEYLQADLTHYGYDETKQDSDKHFNAGDGRQMLVVIDNFTKKAWVKVLGDSKSKTETNSNVFIPELCEIFTGQRRRAGVKTPYNLRKEFLTNSDKFYLNKSKKTPRAKELQKQAPDTIRPLLWYCLDGKGKFVEKAAKTRAGVSVGTKPLPLVLGTDPGEVFTSNDFQLLMRQLKIRVSTSITGKAASQGLVERFNGTLKKSLKKYLQSNALEKGDVVDGVEAKETLVANHTEVLMDFVDGVNGYNNRPHAALNVGLKGTKYTPNEVAKAWHDSNSENEELKQKGEKVIQDVKVALDGRKVKKEFDPNLGYGKIKFEEGDIVRIRQYITGNSKKQYTWSRALFRIVLDRKGKVGGKDAVDPALPVKYNVELVEWSSVKKAFVPAIIDKEVFKQIVGRPGKDAAGDRYRGLGKDLNGDTRKKFSKPFLKEELQKLPTNLKPPDKPPSSIKVKSTTQVSKTAQEAKQGKSDRVKDKAFLQQQTKKYSNLKKGDKIIYATTFDDIDDKSNRWLVEILSKTSKGYKGKFIADKAVLPILYEFIVRIAKGKEKEKAFEKTDWTA